jgi:hypothetical protein
VEVGMNHDQPKFTTFGWMVKNVVHGHPMDLNNPKDLDKVLLCNKIFQIATQYMSKWRHKGTIWRQLRLKEELNGNII